MMQRHFYFTQHGSSAFAALFPLDSVCNSDWALVLHVVTHHRNPKMGKSARAGGQAKAQTHRPPVPWGHHGTRRGQGCPEGGAAALSRTASCQREQLSRCTPKKTDVSQRITWASGSTSTRFIYACQIKSFSCFLKLETHRTSLKMSAKSSIPSQACSGRAFAEAVCTTGLCLARLPSIYLCFAAHSAAPKSMEQCKRNGGP